MPPQRTIPPAKAVKTERTHEENQERAYIAASRRSDRSLEARVESARRASEIHKRRTGRSLRVTEQDVINEEMYEEEDDDLPLQYRRLTAHLQTGSSEFNRRLAAYLTNQLAMRSAVDHAINNSYAQQYPNAPSFAHNQLAAYPSPFYQQQPSFHDESHRYRQAPYPTPNSNMQRMQQHGRAASIATPREMAGFDDAHVNPNMVHTPMVSDQRRMSMPTSSTSPAGVGIPSPAQSMSSGQRPSMSRNPSQQSSHTHHSSQQGDSNQSMPPPRAQPQGFNNAHTDISPFTTSLPHESSQLLLGASVDQGIDPYMSMLMAGSGSGMINPQLFTPSYDMPLSKQRGQQPTLYNNNMGGTLSPSVLDLSQGQPDFGQFPPTGTAPVPTYGQFFDSSFPGFNPEKDHNLTKIDGQDDGNIVNPGLDGDWNTFINGHPWEETAS